MSIVRRVALGVLSPLFVFLLFATAFDIGFTHTVTHPAAVKKLAAESGIYSSLVPSLLKQQPVIATPLGDIPTSDPAVQAAIGQAISPKVIQTQANSAIDSIYQWLDGKVNQPDFTIGLANPAGFADSVSGSIDQKLAGLPVCDLVQSLAIIQSGTFDAAQLTCLPRGASPSEAAGQIKSALSDNQDLLNSLSITPADIKGGNGQPVFEQPGAKNIPTQYQRAKKMPAILVILTILTGAAIILLSGGLKGLRRVGASLLIVGAAMLIFSWALSRAVSAEIIPKIKVDNTVLQQGLRNLATDIGQRIDRNYWIFGGVYTVLGAAAITSPGFYKRRVEAESAPADSSRKTSSQ